jgi:LacI family transcriptional regulator
MSEHTRILIAVSNLEEGWQRETLCGIREFAESSYWSLFVELLDEWPERKAQVSRWNLAGMIIDVREKAHADLFAEFNVPKVNYSDCLVRSPLPRVMVDNFRAGGQAAQHFLERGIVNMAFLGVDRGFHYAMQRQAGFQQWAEQRRARFMSLPETAVTENDGDAFRAWLDRTPKPVGVLAADDYLASSVARRLMEWEIEVPVQVLVLGFNNDVFNCEFCQPSLSSVIMPSRAIGYKAAEMLDTLLRGRRLAKDELLIPSPGVAERTSTRTVAFGCPELDAALRFIRQNAARPIGVKQVVDHVAISKRTLEQLFEHHLGHGPGEELRRVRLELAKFYLTTTSRPVTEIARISGFSSATHLGLVMRRYERQTPMQYRKQRASVAS